jgi:DNA-binding IscR family transcriptional regulator
MKHSARSTRFPVAMHIMTMLALVNLREGPIFLSSAFLAKSAAKNGASLRVTLGQLSKAGLIETAAGSRGGSRLARDARDITCLEIYKSVEAKSLFGVHEGNPDCLICTYVGGFMESFFDEAERRFERELNTVCLADVADNLNVTATAEGFEFPTLNDTAPHTQ